MAYYRGSARDVVTRALDGRTVRFPASILRPYVTYAGVQGVFALQCDADGRFESLRRIGHLKS